GLNRGNHRRAMFPHAQRMFRNRGDGWCCGGSWLLRGWLWLRRNRTQIVGFPFLKRRLPIRPSGASPEDPEVLNLIVASVGQKLVSDVPTLSASDREPSRAERISFSQVP